MTPRLRFSLRTLLVLVAIVAGATAWWVYRAAAERRHQARLAALTRYEQYCSAVYAKEYALRLAETSEGLDADFYGSELAVAKADVALENGDHAAAISELEKALEFALKHREYVFASRYSTNESFKELMRGQVEAERQITRIELKLADLSPETFTKMQQIEDDRRQALKKGQPPPAVTSQPSP